LKVSSSVFNDIDDRYQKSNLQTFANLQEPGMLPPKLGGTLCRSDGWKFG